MYGQKEDGLALTLDVHRPAQPNGAGLISIVSGGWQSSVELARIFTQARQKLCKTTISTLIADGVALPDGDNSLCVQSQPRRAFGRVLVPALLFAVTAVVVGGRAKR